MNGSVAIPCLLISLEAVKSFILPEPDSSYHLQNEKGFSLKEG
jgi:hypothetical protein